MIKEQLLKESKGSKKKEKYINRLYDMSNEQLLDTMINAQEPDDYDGMFTEEGEWKSKFSIAILKDKLQQIGWL